MRRYKRMSKDELISSMNESKPRKRNKDIRNLRRLKKDQDINDRILK